MRGKTVVTGFKTTTGTAVTKVDFGSTIFVGQLLPQIQGVSMADRGRRARYRIRSSPHPWYGIRTSIRKGLPSSSSSQSGPFGGGSTTASAMTRTARAARMSSTSSTPGGITIDLFANLGQFVYDTASPQNQFTTGASSPGGRNDTWLFGTQVGARGELPKIRLRAGSPDLLQLQRKERK